MTDEELQKVVAAVIQSLKTNSKTINQLTAVSSVLESDNIEISQGRRITVGLFIKAIHEAMNITGLEDELHKLANYLQLVEEDGFFYVDAAGNIAFRYTPADGLDAAKVSRHLSDLILLRLVTDEDGFYYTDAAGNIVMKYTPADGFDVAKVSEHFKSLLPAGGGGDYSDLTETIYNI